MNDFANFREENNKLAEEALFFKNVIEKLQKRKIVDNNEYEPYLVCDPDAFGCYFHNEKCFLGYSFSLLDFEKPEEKEYTLSLALHKQGVKGIKDYSEYPYVSDGRWYYFKIDTNIFSNDEREKLLLEYCGDILNELLKA